MKCNMPRAWEALPKKDKDVISRVCSEMMKEQFDEGIQTVQEVLIKMACIILHDEFGFCASSELGGRHTADWTGKSYGRPSGWMRSWLGASRRMASLRSASTT